MTTKQCTKCEEVKSLDAFGRRGKDKKPHTVCKACVNQARKDWRAANPEKVKEISKKDAIRVREWRRLPGNMDRKNAGERERRKDPAVKAKNIEYERERRNRPGIREKMNTAERHRRKTDPEYRQTLIDAQKEYYSRPEVKERVSKKNKELYATQEWKEKFNARRRERYATDPEFLCGVKLRAIIVRTCKKAKTVKDGKTIDLLGYSAHQLRLRIEFQFKDGMTWENYGEWHIDHKKPIAAFLAQGVTNPKIINALSNLQPLWAEDNQAKSYKWISPIADNDNLKRSTERAA